MYYKTFSRILASAGWEVIDEGHGGNIYPHYYKYAHPKDQSRDDRFVIEFVCADNKNGTPGRILKAWQGGKPVRL